MYNPFSYWNPADKMAGLAGVGGRGSVAVVQITMLVGWVLQPQEECGHICGSGVATGP